MAWTTVEILAIISGVVYLIAGVLVALSIVLFLSGWIVYYVLFGMLGKERGVKLMEWGVSCLIMFIFLTTLTRFFVAMPGVVNIIISAVVLFVVLKVVMAEFTAPAPKKKDAKHA